MTSEPRAFFAIDQGAATTSAALVGVIAGRWRLIGSVALSSGVELEQVLGLLVARLRNADPMLAAEIGLLDGGSRPRRRRDPARVLVDLALPPDPARSRPGLAAPRGP